MNRRGFFASVVGALALVFKKKPAELVLKPRTEGWTYLLNGQYTFTTGGTYTVTTPNAYDGFWTNVAGGSGRL